MAWRSEAREGFEVKDARSAPPPAAALRAVLEFESLSRKIAAKQSTDESAGTAAPEGLNWAGSSHSGWGFETLPRSPAPL